MMSLIPESVKSWLDVASFSAAAGTLIGWLPHIAAALSVFWLGYRFYAALTQHRHCQHATLGCPAMCPGNCPHYRSKKR